MLINSDIMANMPEQLSMSLGAGETTLMKLTAAYAMLVNGGKQIRPTFIDRIQDRNGKTIFKQEERICLRVMQNFNPDHLFLKCRTYVRK